MKNTRLIPLLILPALLLLASCDEGITGSSEISTITYDLKNFTAVSADDGCLLTFIPDTAWAVEVMTNDNFVRHLLVDVHGGVLRIRLEPGFYYDIGKVFRATVRMPRIEALTLSAGSRGDLGTGFASDAPLALTLSGGSEARGTIDCGDFSAVLSGGSDLQLYGTAEDAFVNASGGSDVNCGNFRIRDGDLVASGGSDVTVHATGLLDVEASGGSEIWYRGPATLRHVNTSGGSTVRRMQ